MRFYSRMMLATGGLSIAIVFAWVLAVLSVVGHHRHELQPAPVPRTAQRERTTTVQMPPYDERHTPHVVLGTPNAEKPYVASIRQDSKTFHLRECSKFGKSLKVVKEYATAEEAIADGKSPCTYCLGVAHR